MMGRYATLKKEFEFLVKTQELLKETKIAKAVRKWFEDNWSSFYDIDGNLGDSEIVILEEDGSEYILKKGCWVVKDCRGAFQIVPDDLFKNNYQEYKEN